MTIITTIKLIRCDAARYGTGWIRHPGFWVGLSYRIRRLRKYSSWPYQILLPLDLLFGIFRRCFSDTALPSSVAIGAGLYLPHPQGIIINGMADIGREVSIFQQITIGEWHGKAPRIGDRCAIFGGAKIFGDISVGSDCKLGANTVVNIDVPANTSVSVGAAQFRQRPRRGAP
jgi:serine O-acetyltransferase